MNNHYSQVIFAGGCFWGVEHLMRQQNGVISVESGYIGGNIENPTYEQVKTGTTEHAEAVRIIYDSTVVDYETLAKLFFEIHDPTQADGQGPDIGSQYRSEIFYDTQEEKTIAQGLINILKSKGFDVQTKLTPVSKFYSAEDYHQNYFTKHGDEHTCHFYTKRF
ncbi:MAG: peptide-methionine (S)-S-oxide reductase MsrA [Bacteroidales bacterium]|nr:peptide-methionine (S)-S-oxide reductase MsrA [Bacteroidales bacterium]